MLIILYSAKLTNIDGNTSIFSRLHTNCRGICIYIKYSLAFNELKYDIIATYPDASWIKLISTTNGYESLIIGAVYKMGQSLVHCSLIIMSTIVQRSQIVMHVYTQMTLNCSVL